MIFNTKQTFYQNAIVGKYVETDASSAVGFPFFQRLQQTSGCIPDLLSLHLLKRSTASLVFQKSCDDWLRIASGINNFSWIGLILKNPQLFIYGFIYGDLQLVSHVFPKAIVFFEHYFRPIKSLILSDCQIMWDSIQINIFLNR